jgi:membrane protein
VEVDTSGVLFYREVNWKRVLRRVIAEIRRDDVMGRSAQLSYFLAFSLVPSLLMLSVALGYVARGDDARRMLLNYIRDVAPGPGFQVIRDIVEQLAGTANAGSLSFGLLTALWAASTGMNAVISGLNKAYEIREERPWWKARIIAVLMTIGLGVLVTSALVIVVYGRQLGRGLAEWLGYGSSFQMFWSLVRWPSVLIFAFSGFLLIYRFGPNLTGQKWRWILPGAGFALVLWLIASFGLRFYMHYFPSYGAVYGALGAILGLLLWLYLTGAAVLIGGELNSEIEAAAAAGGNPDAKRPGEKAPPGGDGPLSRRDA